MVFLEVGFQAFRTSRVRAFGAARHARRTIRHETIGHAASKSAGFGWLKESRARSSYMHPKLEGLTRQTLPPRKQPLPARTSESGEHGPRVISLAQGLRFWAVELAYSLLFVRDRPHVP